MWDATKKAWQVPETFQQKVLYSYSYKKYLGEVCCPIRASDSKSFCFNEQKFQISMQNSHKVYLTKSRLRGFLFFWLRSTAWQICLLVRAWFSKSLNDHIAISIDQSDTWLSVLNLDKKSKRRYVIYRVHRDQQKLFQIHHFDYAYESIQ